MPWPKQDGLSGDKSATGGKSATEDKSLSKVKVPVHDVEGSFDESHDQKDHLVASVSGQNRILPFPLTSFTTVRGKELGVTSPLQPTNKAC